MKTFFGFLVWFLLWATAMYFVFQTSMKSNVDLLVNSTIDTLKQTLVEQSKTVDTKVIEKTNTQTWWNHVQINQEYFDKLIQQQKDQIEKILEQKKKEIMSKLENSVKSYLVQQVEQIFNR